MKHVRFDIAKLAEEKGFCEYCNDTYVETLEHTIENNHTGEEYVYNYKPAHIVTRDFLFSNENKLCSAPTISNLQDWLEEKHNIYIEILIDKTCEPKFCFEIHKYKDFGNWMRIDKRDEFFLYQTKSKALETALYVALINI